MTASVAELRARQAKVAEALTAVGLSRSRRRFLEAKAAELDTRLAGRCEHCGRTLSNGGSVGPTCARKAVAS